MSGGAVRAGRAYLEVFLKDQVSAGLRQVSRRLRNVASVLSSVGSQLLGVGLGLAAPLAIAATTFASFDDAMRSVGAVTSSTQSQLASMTAVAKDLGATTSFTAVQVASLMTELGRAGFNPSQIEDMTGAVLNLSRATGTEAPASANIMAAAIRQFGLAAGDATRIADVMTATANKTFNSVEQLGDALTYAGPVAKQFNMSFEDTLAVLGGLGNVGIQASSAGTALRRLLTLTGADAQRLKGIFGVSFVDAAGNARPLVQVLGEVNRATAGLGTAARAAKFNEAFGLLGITASGVISESTADIAGLAEELRNAEGTAARTAAEMDAGLGGSFRILGSVAGAVSLAVGEALAPALMTVATAAQDALGHIEKFISENQSLVVAVASVAGALIVGGGLLLSVGLAASVASAAIGGLATIAGIVGTAFGFLATLSAPFVIAAAAVGVLVAAAAGLVAFVLWPRQISAAFDWLGKNIATFFTEFIRIAGIAIGTLRESWALIQGWLTAKFIDLFERDFVGSIAKGILRALSLFQDMKAQLIQAIITGNFSPEFNAKLNAAFTKGLATQDIAGDLKAILDKGLDETGLFKTGEPPPDANGKSSEETDAAKTLTEAQKALADATLAADKNALAAEEQMKAAMLAAETEAAKAGAAVPSDSDQLPSINQQAQQFAKGDNTKKAFGGDVASTASSAVAALLAAGTGGTAKVEERVADATEKTADNTEQTKNLTEGIAANVGRLGTVG